MECSVCGSQDTTPKQGISKKTGKPWKAYDCNESGCKNDKGYPNRTFAPFGGKNVATGLKTPNNGIVAGSLEVKIDKILAILNTNFPPNVEETNEETSPF